jgi:hypothetical protein
MLKPVASRKKGARNLFRPTPERGCGHQKKRFLTPFSVTWQDYGTVTLPALLAKTKSIIGPRTSLSR